MKKNSLHHHGSVLLMAVSFLLVSCFVPYNVGMIEDESDAGISGDGGDCLDISWGQFNVLDFFYDQYGPAGCTSKPGLVPALLGSIRLTDKTTLEMHVRREDNTPFPAGRLRLYVGNGPICADPLDKMALPNVEKNKELSVEGNVEQFVELKLAENYDASSWSQGETKQFWMLFEDYTIPGGYSATSMVLVERHCIP